MIVIQQYHFQIKLDFFMQMPSLSFLTLKIKEKYLTNWRHFTYSNRNNNPTGWSVFTSKIKVENSIFLFPFAQSCQVFQPQVASIFVAN